LLATVLFQTLEKVVGVVRRVVVNNVWGIVRVDFVNVFAELAAGLSLDLLDLLEATGLHEGTLGLELEGQHLGELGADVGKNIVGGKLEEGFKGGNVSAHLDDVLQGLLALVLQVLAGLGNEVDGEETGGHVSLSEELGVLRGVATDLTEGPGSSSLEVVLRLVDKGILERSNTLANNDGHSEGVIESRDIAEGHDTGEASVALGLTDVVNSGGSATGVNDKLGQLSGLLSDLTDAGSSVLADLDIDILEAVKDTGEDLGLNDDLSKINGVLSDLSEALANVSLELGIGVRDQSSEVGNGTLVNDGLGEFFGVLGDLRESGSRDALEGELGLLDAEDQKTNGTGINNRLSELVVVLGNA